MTTLVGYKRFQSLHPLSLLTQLIHHRTSGCLQVASGFAYWSIYLDQGKLTYATNSQLPFDRLDRHLQILSDRVTTLGHTVRHKVSLRYGRKPFQPYGAVNADYEAVCELVAQRCLEMEDAVYLIQQLTEEVLAAFLKLQEGSYEIIEKSQFDTFPNLCHLELRSLLDRARLISPPQPAPFIPRHDYASPAIPQTANSADRSTLQPTTSSIVRPTATPSRPSTVYPVRQPIPRAPMHPEIHPAQRDRDRPIVREVATFKIACIDDSPSILQVMRSHLNDQDCAVLMINDPLKALMQIIRQKPDLVLLDVGMPNLDGYELCSMLRRHPAFKELPVVMVTGHTGFIDRARAKLVGASGYLTKPFTKEELLDIVSKYSGKHHT